MKRFVIPVSTFGGEIVIQADDRGCGFVENSIQDRIDEPEDGVKPETAMDGVESLLLALATKGIDLNDARIISAVQDVCEAIDNQD